MEESAVLERAREKRDSEARDEAYWRGRARDLRNEIAENDAQINYVRGRLSEISQSNYGPVLGGGPYYGPYGTLPNIPGTNPGVIINGGRLPQYPNGGVFGPDRPRIYNPPYRRQRPYDIFRYPNGYPGYGYPPYGYPPYSYPPYGYPNGSASPYDYSANTYERDNLTERLNNLIANRAALNTRWLQLEDEARDARIPQIWLEP